MKITHVIGALIAGGAERFVVSLVCSLKKIGWDCELFVMSSRTDAASQEMKSQLDSSGVHWYCGSGAKVNASTILAFRKELAARRPEIIHLHTPNTELLYAASSIGFSNQHCVVRTLHSSKMPGSMFLRAIMRRNLAKANIACGIGVAIDKPWFISGDIVHIANGINFTWAPKHSVDVGKLRCTLKVREDAYVFVHVGRMSGQNISTSPKAHDVLISAWLRAELWNSGGELHLLGDGNYRKTLEVMCRGNTSVKFHGVVSNPHEWYQIADSFVLPSRYEGLPIAAIEAVSTGLPCILSDIPAFGVLTSRCTTTVPVESIEALSTSLRTMKENPALPTAEEVDEFRARFEISKVAVRYASIYAQHCAGPSQRRNVSRLSAS